MPTSTMTSVKQHVSAASHRASSRLSLLIGALGVVYGDIGTSPLYTLRICLVGYGGFQPEHVLGVLSILFWMLMLVVSFKYIVIVLRADNRGEGGTLALLELVLRGYIGKRRHMLIMLAIFGAALFYGDSMITPAISVLSALEGISVVSHRLEQWVLPCALLVLVGLFMIQSHGTGVMGRLFGPIMGLWFLTLAALGAWQIWQMPAILMALDPAWAIRFALGSPAISFLLLGSVVLALTGAEALYADMGHFGRKAIQQAWFWLVMPALTLCYFGQGALLLRDPTAIINPFFKMAPDWGVVPLVGLATAATIIASQSVISGAYSMTRQAIQLGYWPRMEILHTSVLEKGQIYVPQVNTFLLIMVMVLVLVFRSSDKLAAAYGFAVTGTMLTTSLLLISWRPRAPISLLRYVLWRSVLGLLLAFDTLLFLANIIKVEEGGWLPLSIGILFFTLMLTWRRGRHLLTLRQQRSWQPLMEFMTHLEQHPPARVSGTAVFMTLTPDHVPAALLHNLKHNKVLHDHVLFLTIRNADVPYMNPEERFSLTKVSTSSWRAIVTYGFKEHPDIPQILREIAQAYPELDLDTMRTSYYLSRQTIVAATRPAMRHWRRSLFTFMARNATRSTRFFNIPSNRVVEMGMQVEL